MVYANGQLPASELREVWGGMRLPLKAADAWDAMWAAAKTDGIELIPTSDQVAPWTNPPGAGTGMYRDYSLQRWMYAVRGKAACAAPGYSVHGTLPGCVDIYNEPSPRVRVWLDENAARFGWHRTIKSESWHFGYDGTTVAGNGGLEIIVALDNNDKDFILRAGAWHEFQQFAGLDENGWKPAVRADGTPITAMLKDYLRSTLWYVQNTFNRLFGDPTKKGTVAQGGAGGILDQILAATGGPVTITIDDAAANLIAQKVATLIQSSLDDLPTNGEIGQALTSTVALVNEHADANKDAIIAAIPSDGSGGSASTYALSLNIEQVPGTATGTATPQ